MEVAFPWAFLCGLLIESAEAGRPHLPDSGLRSPLLGVQLWGHRPGGGPSGPLVSFPSPGKHARSPSPLLWISSSSSRPADSLDFTHCTISKGSRCHSLQPDHPLLYPHHRELRQGLPLHRELPAALLATQLGDGESLLTRWAVAGAPTLHFQFWNHRDALIPWTNPVNFLKIAFPLSDSGCSRFSTWLNGKAF